MKKLLTALLFLVLLITLIPCSANSTANSTADPTANERVYIEHATRTNLLGMSTTALSGAHIDSSIFTRHDLTVLHYFATWSADCIKELQFMQEAKEAFGSNTAILGLLHEDAVSTPAAALDIINDLGISYPVVHLDSVLETLVNESNYIPQTFFVDSAGNVIYRFVGTFSSYSVLEAMIEANLPPNETFYTVRFFDGLTGALLKTQRVLQGGSAFPPKPPAHSGYEFVSWTGNYINVQHDENVYARYVEIQPPPMLGDVDGDGSITFVDSLLVARYALELPTSDFNLNVADINEDGSVDFNDSLMIFRIALQIE